MLFKENKNARPDLIATRAVDPRVQRASQRLTPMSGYGGFDGEGVAMQTALQAGFIGPNVGKAWNPSPRGLDLPGRGVAMQTGLQAGFIGPNVGTAWHPGRRARLGRELPGGDERFSDYGQADDQGNIIPGTNPYNFTTNPDSDYVDPGTGGDVTVPPQGKAGGIDWSAIFTAVTPLATGIVSAIVKGTQPSVGTSCPAGFQYNAKAGVCMTPAAYAAWQQSQKASGMSSTTTMILVGGAVLVGVALLMGKRRSGAMAGYGRWHKRKSHRKVRRARR